MAKTKAEAASEPELDDVVDVPAWDSVRLIEEMRKGNPEAVARAYRVTFGSELGRLVLADHAAEMSVGSVLGPNAGDYLVGKHDAAVELMHKAGFDQFSIAVAVLTDKLEGQTDDGSYRPTDAEPID
jgi:hypothetical protein